MIIFWSTFSWTGFRKWVRLINNSSNVLGVQSTRWEWDRCPKLSTTEAVVMHLLNKFFFNYYNDELCVHNFIIWMKQVNEWKMYQIVNSQRCEVIVDYRLIESVSHWVLCLVENRWSGLHNGWSFLVDFQAPHTCDTKIIWRWWLMLEWASWNKLYNIYHQGNMMNSDPDGRASDGMWHYFCCATDPQRRLLWPL